VLESDPADANANHLDLEVALRHQLLQPSVLRLQMFQAPHVTTARASAAAKVTVRAFMGFILLRERCDQLMDRTKLPRRAVVASRAERLGPEPDRYLADGVNDPI
jgi:hypothetical protein